MAEGQRQQKRKGFLSIHCRGCRDKNYAVSIRHLLVDETLKTKILKEEGHVTSFCCSWHPCFGRTLGRNRFGLSWNDISVFWWGRCERLLNSHNGDLEY